MKKIFVLFLCLLCLSMPSVAKTKNKRKPSQKATAQSSTAKQKAPPTQEDKISAEVQRYQEENKRKIADEMRAEAKQKRQNGLPVLSWEKFEEKAKKTPSYIKNLNSSVSIPNRYSNIKTENPSELIFSGDPTLTGEGAANFATGKAVWAVGEPDWAMLLEDNKFLFLGETFFGSASSLEATKSAVRNLRKTLPNTRILLATEFVQNTSLSANPLYKAGQNNPGLKERYPLFSFADEQNIDILALDDRIFDIVDIDPVTIDNKYRIDKDPVLKAGDEYIRIPHETSEGHQALMDTITGKSLLGANSLLFVEKIVKQSLYGIRSTNKQWAQRIASVQKRYDIVIVYVSDDHLLMDGTSLIKNLTNSLEGPKVQLSPIVILSPATSQVPAAAQAEYNNLVKTLNDFQFTEQQYQLSEEMGKTTDPSVRDIYLWQITAIEENKSNLLTDLFSYAGLIRSLHSYVAVMLETPSAGVNAQDVLNVFIHPFWVELSSSQDIVEQISKKQGKKLSVLYEPEGHIIFYHVGEAQAAEYIQMSAPSATK